MDKKKIIGFYDYTVVLTYLGMALSFFGIAKIINGEYARSIIYLMGAGVCDMFDGAVASTKERNCYEKHFGIQIDSLCDLVSFGVLPAILTYVITGKSRIAAVLTCIYVLCGLIRLAYFNVQEFERQKVTDERRDVYLGVPITTSALVMPFTFLLYDKVSAIGTGIFLVATVVLAIGFITGVEIKKPGMIGKIILIIVGIAELVGMYLVLGQM